MNFSRRFGITAWMMAASLMMPMIAQAQPTPAPTTASCPCTCSIETPSGTVTEIEPVQIGSGTGQASTLAAATGKCTDTSTNGACSARSIARSGTIFRGHLGACEASLFPGTAGETSGSSGTAGSGDRIRLYNPLGTDIGVAEFISRAIRAVIGFIGALALLMFIYGGLMYMTAGGDNAKVKTAQEIIRNSTIGLLLIFFSYSLVATVFGLLGGA